jgi:hypothetical protein
LLDYVLNHLPIGFHELEWCVAAEHNEKYPDKDQTGLSIQKKILSSTWSKINR